jgi:hypothetical protein
MDEMEAGPATLPVPLRLEVGVDVIDVWNPLLCPRSSFSALRVSIVTDFFREMVKRS